MKRIFEIVKNNPLFMDIGIADFDKMFLCLGAKAENYRKGEVVFLSGNPITAVGLVLSGGVRVVREDIDGRSHTLAELGAGELFGETLACAAVDHSPVTVLAVESSEILLLNYRKIIATCAE
ncbi:MAG: cyclic nucleotide-binding domain-containing protein, partial [Oscillospiraceae bacterium]